MKKMKLFPKTFLHCLALLVSVILIAFLLIYLLLPKCYQRYKQYTLNSDTAQLAEQLKSMSSQDISASISTYAIPKNYGYCATDGEGDIICYAQTGIQMEFISNDIEDTETTMNFDFEVVRSDATFQTTDDKTIILTLHASLQPIGDAMSVLLLLIPPVLLFCLLLATIISYFYAKSITNPIRNIAQKTVQMQSLAPNISCDEDRNDEIGVLSENINQMYKKLLHTISDLEKEIQTVSKSEQEKLDFLLLASHELKTPVTAVRGMVDGMLYNVGIYRDRDTYLKECQKTLKHLTTMLCEILETSKMDITAAAKETEEIDIGTLLAQAASPYHIIAQSKEIVMTLALENTFLTVIAPALIEKALSNVLSNAVKYTDKGKAIRIYIEDRCVVIENECEPLSAYEQEHISEPFYRPTRKEDSLRDRTGLGLYFTDHLLHALKLSYTFEPYKDGMRFILKF